MLVPPGGFAICAETGAEMARTAITAILLTTRFMASFF
jgi:hypothetical protein